MPGQLISPNHRRIIDRDSMPLLGVSNLRQLGWVDYHGPAKVTVGLDERATPEVFKELGVKVAETASGATHRGTRNGWYIPGTDPSVDRQLQPVLPRT